MAVLSGSRLIFQGDTIVFLRNTALLGGGLAFISSAIWYQNSLNTSLLFEQNNGGYGSALLLAGVIPSSHSENFNPFSKVTFFPLFLFYFS